MDEHELWNEVVGMIFESNRKVQIFDGSHEVGRMELELLNLNGRSVLGTVILYTSGICIDNWVRIIGQTCIERKGLITYNNVGEKIFLDGMLIIGQDIVGGIFAINNRRFIDGLHKVWYFAPDTLEWECLDMKYAEFFTWLINGNIDEFYSSMRWNNWREDCKNVTFDEVILIYPFLWAKECNLNRASKKVVSYEELKELNFELAEKL